MKRISPFDELIEAIACEMDRIFGFEEYPTRQESDWLGGAYDISREEHVRYELILEYVSDDLDEEQKADEESMAFLRDEAAVLRFLEGLLKKYRSGTEVYRHTLM